MTAIRCLLLTCDAPDCSEQWEFGLGHAQKFARKVAERHGWSCTDAGDFCKQHDPHPAAAKEREK